MSGAFGGLTSPKNEDELRTLAILDLVVVNAEPGAPKRTRGDGAVITANHLATD